MYAKRWTLEYKRLKNYIENALHFWAKRLQKLIYIEKHWNRGNVMIVKKLLKVKI